jgi:hypothetical protein
LQNQEQIIKILDKVFVWEEIQGKNNVIKKVITLHPKLDLKELDKIILEARKLILGLYFKCETNFKEGLHVFEAIIKDRRLKTAISRNKTLGEEFNKTVGENEISPKITEEINKDLKETALKSVEPKTGSDPEPIKNDKIEQELIPKNNPI